MSKIFRKAINKLSSSGSERSNDSDSESVNGSKPKRSISFRRSSQEKTRKGSKLSSSVRSSIDSSSRTLTDINKPQLQKHVEEPTIPVLTPVDVTVDITHSEDIEAEEPQTGLLGTEHHDLQKLKNSSHEVPGALGEENEIPHKSLPDQTEVHDAIEPTVFNADEHTGELTGDPARQVANEENRSEGNKSPLHKIPKSPFLSDIVEDLEPLLERTLSGLARVESVEAPPSLWWTVFVTIKDILVYLDPRDPKLVHLIFLLLLGLAAVAYLVFSNLDTLVAQSVEFNLQSVSVSKINSDGVDSHVVATVYVNYDNISNYVYKNALKLGGFVIGGLTISPVKPTRFYVKPTALDIAPLHLVDIYPPPLTLDVMNKGLTEVDFISKISIIKEDIVKLSHEIQKIKLANISLDVHGVVNSKIDSQLFHLSASEINFFETLTLSKDELVPDVKVEEFTAISSGKAIQIHTQIGIIPKQEELPFEFLVQGINWDVLVYDCDDKLVQLGNWKSKLFEIERNSDLLVLVEGIIEEIDDRLTTPCHDATKSPFNQILQHYLNEEPINLVIRGSKVQDEMLPDWLYYVLKDINYELEVTLPRQSAQLSSLEVGSVDIEINQSSPSTDSVDLLLSSNMTITVPYEAGIKFQIPKFKTNFVIKDIDGRDIIRGLSPTYDQMQVTVSNDSLALELDLSGLAITLLDPLGAGKLADRALTDGPQSIFYDISLDLELLEIQFELELFSSVITGLSLKNLTVPRIPKYELQFIKQDPSKLIQENALIPSRLIPSFDDLAEQIDLTILNIIYVDSTVNGITFLCDYEIHNPTNFSIDIPGESISFAIQYDGTSLSRSTLSDIYIPRLERYNSTVKVEVLAEEIEDKIVLEKFLSAFISQYEIEVSISDIQATSNQALNRLLQQITIPKMAIPSLKFDIHSQTAANNGSNPFIVESTMHVLSSDAELKVFNPVSNAELIVELYQAQASHDGVDLGYTQRLELLLVPPGVYQTPRMPIKTNQGIGTDILRKAINGELKVDVVAVFKARLDRFETQLICRSHHLETQIRL